MRFLPSRSPASYKKQSGLIVVFATLAMFVFLAIAGLVLDTGYAYYKKRQLQTAADAAALNGAYTLMAGGENNDIRKKARASTKSHGFRNGDDDVDVDMNWPPTYGHYIDNTSAVQVEVEYTHDTFFLGIVGMDTLTYSANATALVGGEANETAFMYWVKIM
ncbi:hypothetical protein JCM19231_3160 [Vibrio ishigakensis]|uniref:Putative Flp pilus-assembly TadG-like N-terminal domain-containing protein n=1 Tax=Vibrio ishigakensis TaxID=1481914 RepID=A0A0B8NUV4_9VIBR|nr:hypothetical protein JCM19231_3160 [Vibrio ishigakensis]